MAGFFQWSQARLPLIAASLLGLTLLSLGAATAFYINRQNWVIRTHDVEGDIDAVLSAAQDAELALRGYALTGNEVYRERIARDRARFYRELDRLVERTRDNPVQQATMARMRQRADHHFATNPSLFDGQAAPQPEIAIVNLDPLRESAAQLRDHERALLHKRTAAAQVAGAIALVIAALALAATGLVFFLWLRDRREREGLAKRAETEAIGRRVAESQITQLQKMEAVGRLTGGLAHDFNNMLAVILSALSLMQKRLRAGNQDVDKLLDAARDGAMRAAQLTQRLLAFSRQQPLSPQPVNAGRLIAGMTDLLQRTLGDHIRVETVLGGGLWKTFADESQLENAILNLAINARDAMPNGGKLTIETANAALDDAYARLHQEVTAGQYVMIAVSDTGTGMPPDVLERAFDPFFTTKGPNDGTGLGLSQVHGYVKQSGGHVKIYSEVREGTTVKIYLPRHRGDDQEARAPQREIVVPAGDSAEVILVVEDDYRLREIAVAALRESGYTIIPAHSGAEALRLLDQHPEICCLFTDIVMPEMSGRELADQAIQRRPDLKVLYTTGYTRNAVVHGGVLDPGVNFLSKPFTAESLAHKVREVLGPPRRQTEKIDM